MAVALTLVALTVAGLLVWRLRWAGTGGWVTPTIFAGDRRGLGGAALLGARMGADRFTIGAITWAALTALVGRGRPRRPVRIRAPRTPSWPPWWRWSPRPGWAGSPAATGPRPPRSSTVSVAVLGAAIARMFFAVPGQRIAVVVLVGVLTVSLAAPAIGRRLARVPRQSFESITGKDMYERTPADPEDTISPVADSPRDITLTGEQVGEVARRSNRVLMGVLLGNALGPGGGLVVCHPSRRGQPVDASWWWPRHRVDRGVARPRVSGPPPCHHRGRRRGAVAVRDPRALRFCRRPRLGRRSCGPPRRSVGIALAALVAGAVVPHPMFSEPVREVAEYLEYVATALVVVFAAWAIDLVHFVRYH